MIQTTVGHPTAEETPGASVVIGPEVSVRWCATEDCLDTSQERSGVAVANYRGMIRPRVQWACPLQTSNCHRHSPQVRGCAVLWKGAVEAPHPRGCSLHHCHCAVADGGIWMTACCHKISQELMGPNETPATPAAKPAAAAEAADAKPAAAAAAEPKPKPKPMATPAQTFELPSKKYAPLLLLSGQLQRLLLWCAAHSMFVARSIPPLHLCCLHTQSVQVCFFCKGVHQIG